tara:strand:- start:444 stop:707 length:264 start_codon:yes stop_codon:yes gene_type:complete
MKSYIAFGAFGAAGVAACIFYSFSSSVDSTEVFLSECFADEIVYSDKTFDSIHIAPLVTFTSKAPIVFPEIQIRGEVNEPDENSRRQ